jgi:hypothetical protein
MASHRAGLDAEAAEDAAQLVDDEGLGEALVAAAGVALGVFAGLDGDALRGAGGGAAEAGDAAGRAVLAQRQAVQAAEALGIRALLLGVVDGRHALFERFEHRIGLLAQGHLLRVLEEVAHGDGHALQELGDVGLHVRGAVAPANGLAHHLLHGGLRPGVLGAGLAIGILVSGRKGQAWWAEGLVPPAAAAKRAAVEWMKLLRSTGSRRPAMKATKPPAMARATRACVRSARSLRWI